MINFIENLSTLSRGRDAAKYLARHHMDIAAPTLCKFLSASFISESTRHVGFQAVIYSDRINEFSNEILDYSLKIESIHYNYFLESVSGLTGGIEFTDKFENTFKALADKITKLAKNEGRSQSTENVYRA